MATFIYIKNMVCPRCIKAVEAILKEKKLNPVQIQLGLVVVREEKINLTQWKSLKLALVEQGFEIIDDRRNQTIEKIKNFIIKLIHHSDHYHEKINWSKEISRELHHDYKYLSHLFSSVQGITIEHYIIHQKIEKVKELMTYNELTISEISWKLGYSSPAHLSRQFKQVTGMTPSQFKKLGILKRRSLDKV